MTAFFRTVLDMSITGSWVILAVMLARLLLKRAPKWLSYGLWAVAGFRLCCPVSFAAVFSLFNLPTVHTGSSVTRAPAAPMAYQVDISTPQAPVSTPVPYSDRSAGPDIWQVLAFLWLVGMAAMLLFSILCEARLRLKLRTATRLRDNIWRSEHIRSPFILGIFRPRIYLPYDLEGDRARFVLEHEGCHLRRFDHIIKRLAFGILILHWFNPLCHFAFALLNRDMEMSCDEWVLRKNVPRNDYSAALVSVASGSEPPLPGPLAFGETGVKTRVKNILHWKKAGVWTVSLAAVLCLLVILICAADPLIQPTLPDGIYLGITTDADDFNANYTSFYRLDGNSFSVSFGGVTYPVDLTGRTWEDPPFTQTQWNSMLQNCTGIAPESIADCRYMPLFSTSMASNTHINDQTVPMTLTRRVFLLKAAQDIYLCGYSEDDLKSLSPSLSCYDVTAEKLVPVGSKDDPLVPVFSQLDSLMDTILSAPGTLEEKLTAEKAAYMTLLRNRHAPFYICHALKTEKLEGEKGELLARLYADILSRRKEDPLVSRGGLSAKAWIEASLQAHRESAAPLSPMAAPAQMNQFLDNYY